MDPYTQQVAIVTMEVIGGLGLMGIIAGWRLLLDDNSKRIYDQLPR